MIPTIGSKWIYLGNGHIITVTNIYGSTIEISFDFSKENGSIATWWSSWDKICIPLNELNKALYL